MIPYTWLTIIIILFKEKMFYIGTNKSLYISLYICDSQYLPIILANREL